MAGLLAIQIILVVFVIGLILHSFIEGV